MYDCGSLYLSLLFIMKLSLTLYYPLFCRKCWRFTIAKKTQKSEKLIYISPEILQILEKVRYIECSFIIQFSIYILFKVNLFYQSCFSLIGINDFCLCFRGVYLACLLYHGDKVLVTSDDQLPVVEVDENFSGPSVNADLHWLMKVKGYCCQT